MKKILVIDDELDIREIVQISLEEFAGWQCTTVSSAPAGLMKLQEESFDAILLDVSMPDVDGFQFLQMLHNQPIVHNPPVILMTAKVLPQAQQEFDQWGISGVIAKPFNPLTSAEEISTILGWSH